MSNNGRSPKFASIGLVEIGEELAAARKAQAPKQARGLLGRFFHGDDENQWQGHIISEPVEGTYLVELFSWLSGDPCGQKLIKLEQMVDWTFYNSADDMNFAYEYGGVETRWRLASEKREKET